MHDGHFHAYGVSDFRWQIIAQAETTLSRSILHVALGRLLPLFAARVTLMAGARRHMNKSKPVVGIQLSMSGAACAMVYARGKMEHLEMINR
jgi:hypothetical protein